MIPVEKEPEDTPFGMYEKCVFCKETSLYWHIKTNNCVCKLCAKKHKVSELHNWIKQKKKTY